MFNPFSLGLTALSGFNNPEAFASAMSSAGIAPDGTNPLVPTAFQGSPFANFVTPSAATPTQAEQVHNLVPSSVNPQGAFSGDKLLQALQGVRVPMQDNKPIMNAGVSGSQKAPEANIKGMSGGPETVALIQSLLNPSAKANPLRAPSLGALLGGLK